MAWRAGQGSAQDAANSTLGFDDAAYFWMLGRTSSGSPPVRTAHWIRYDPIADVWDEFTHPGVWNVSAALASWGGNVYLFAGRQGTSGATGSGSNTMVTRVYDVGGDSWSTGTSVPGSTPRLNARAVTVDDLIYVFGGYDGGSSDRLDIYDPNGDSWSSGASLPYDAEVPTQPLAMADGIHLVGGIRYTPGTPSTSLLNHIIYHPDTDDYEALADLPNPFDSLEWHNSGGGTTRDPFTGQVWSLTGFDDPGGAGYDNRIVGRWNGSDWTHGPDLPNNDGDWLAAGVVGTVLASVQPGYTYLWDLAPLYGYWDG